MGSFGELVQSLESRVLRRRQTGDRTMDSFRRRLRQRELIGERRKESWGTVGSFRIFWYPPSAHLRRINSSPLRMASFRRLANEAGGWRLEVRGEGEPRNARWLRLVI
jgi:hypothetical protein